MLRVPKLIFFIAALIFFGALTYYFISKETAPLLPYRIAIDITWYPLELYNKREEITIFTEQIAQAIADEQKLPLELLKIISENLVADLDGGEYDGVLAASSIVEVNVENYLFSDPYYLIGPVLIVSTTSPIRSLKDLNSLKDKNIGVITGQNPIMPLYENKKINIVFYDYNNRFQMVNDVINGMIDGMVLSSVTANEYVEGVYKGQLKIVTLPLNTQGLCLIAKKNQRKLINEFNLGLKAIKKNGIYDSLLKKWGLLTL
jgi:polar amino acid transport system substrate-binding protein